MLKRKYVILGFLAFCLTAALFVGRTSSGNQNGVSGTSSPATASPAEYDPWCDIDGNGEIRIKDIVLVALRFGSSGTPINRAAVQFEGNITVPAAAFVPTNLDKDWRNYGYELHNYEASGWSFWEASLELPHRATITNLTTYWLDSGDSVIMCFLFRYNQTWREMMAYAQSPVEAPGLGSSYDDTILYATVDNNKYAYYLEVYVPAPYYNYYFQYAVIEFEY